MKVFRKCLKTSLLLLDGGNHRAAAELLHVVEHVIDTAFVIHHELIRIHTELVDHDVIHGLGAVLGEHEVVRRGSRLLVGVTADEVLGVRGALDEVGHRVDVDELLLGDVPTVDHEIDVEPHLGNFLDDDGIRGGDDLLDDLLHNFLVVVVHAHTLGETPLAVFLADIVGQSDGHTEVAVHLVILQPVLPIGLDDVGFAVEVIGDEGATDIEQEVKLVGQTELVHETGVEGGADGVAVHGGTVDHTAARISVDVEHAVRLVAAENVEQVSVREGIGIEEPAVLDTELLDVVLGVSLGVPGDILLSLRTEETDRAVVTGGRVTRGMLRVVLVQTLELAGGEAETHAEARGGPLGRIEVDGRESDHLGPLGDLPVIVTIIEVRADSGADLPIVPETVRENGFLLQNGGSDDLTGLGRSFLHDRNGVFVLRLGDGGVLGEQGCRGHHQGRSNQNQYFFHIGQNINCKTYCAFNKQIYNTFFKYANIPVRN